jgi:hypothetical protein
MTVFNVIVAAQISHLGSAGLGTSARVLVLCFRTIDVVALGLMLRFNAIAQVPYGPRYNRQEGYWFLVLPQGLSLNRGSLHPKAQRAECIHTRPATCYAHREKHRNLPRSVAWGGTAAPLLPTARRVFGLDAGERPAHDCEKVAVVLVDVRRFHL